MPGTTLARHILSVRVHKIGAVDSLWGTGGVGQKSRAREEWRELRDLHSNFSFRRDETQNTEPHLDSNIGTKGV